MITENGGLHALLDHFCWWNLKDVERSAAVYHEDIIYDFRGPNGIQVKGKEAVSKMIGPWFVAMPNNRAHLKRILMMGNDVAIELVSEEIDPKTGKEILIKEVLFWEIKDGKLYRLIAYRMDPGLFTEDFRKAVESAVKGSSSKP